MESIIGALLICLLAAMVGGAWQFMELAKSLVETVSTMQRTLQKMSEKQGLVGEAAGGRHKHASHGGELGGTALGAVGAHPS